MVKKTPRIYRFVTLPLEISDKMKLHSWKFYKIVLHPLEFQVKNQEPRPMEIPHNIFWIALRNSTSFLWPLEFPYSTFLITLELPCPQPSPVWMFFGVYHWKSGEYIYIYSWLSITQKIRRVRRRLLG